MKKKGTSPTMNQKKRINASGLIWEEWLVVRDCSKEFEVINKATGERKSL